MAKIRVVANHKGAREILTSTQLAKHLSGVADRIAEAGGEGMITEVTTLGERACAVVVTATPRAMVAEANHRALTRAIDAGR